MYPDEGYRRGTVLGLTVAEVFILLLFLMLMVLVGLNHHWTSQTEKLDQWQPIIDSHTMEDVASALSQTNPESVAEQIQELSEEVQELQEEKERLQERIRTLTAEDEDDQQPTKEELQNVKDELEEVERKLEESEAKLERAKALAQTAKNMSTLRDENHELREQMRIIGKGITPPCWYERVAETNPITKADWREKTYYLFDVLIREESMEFQPLPIPEGSAADDGGLTYAEEAEKLQLTSLPYGERLSDHQMLTTLRRITDQAKGSEIRSYSCIFYVRVWDETPAHAKDRWKQAHDNVLEKLFGTYQVKDIGWSMRHLQPVNVSSNASPVSE